MAADGGVPAAGGGAWPSWVRVAGTSLQVHSRAFRRTPAAMFFTIGLPFIMLILFGSLFDWDIDVGLGPIPAAQFYAPGLACFTAASATFTNLSIGLTFQREMGNLKRVRGTPMPPSAYLAGSVGSAVCVALVSTLVMMLAGVLFFGVGIAAAKIPAAIVSFFVGSVAFAACGLAVGALGLGMNSAPAVANAIILPMAFVSNVFMPIADAPRWLQVTGDVLPLKHFANAFSAAFHPAVAAPAWRGVDLAVVAAWGLGTGLVAVRWFRWLPRVSAGTTGAGAGRLRGAARGRSAA